MTVTIQTILSHYACLAIGAIVGWGVAAMFHVGSAGERRDRPGHD